MKAIVSSLLLGILGSTNTCHAIIGGSSIAGGRAPYFVSLVDRSGTHRCGGALIASDMVITSASCEGAGALASARIGYSSSSIAPTEVIEVAQTFPHPNWNAETGVNDIMLIKLRSPSSVTPISMNADVIFPPTGTIVQAMGIGSTANGSRPSQQLNAVPLFPIVDQACNIRIQTLPGVVGVHKEMIGTCYTDYRLQLNNGQCTGDVGGPIVLLGENPDEDLLVAIMIQHSGTCNGGGAVGVTGYPTRGSSTANFNSFITQTVCAESSSSPPDMECPEASAPVVSPTPAPVNPTAAPVPPPTPAPVVPTAAPVTPATPTSPPFSIGLPEDCLARNAVCESSTECCSGRCLVGVCQANASISRFRARASLRGGRGGAGGTIDVGQSIFGFGFRE